jgi:uncharacterized Fe-S cluster-containing radical SAM superfamily protein
MTNLLEKTRRLMNSVTDEKTKKYLLISDFGTSIESKEKDDLYPYFRIFTPVEREKNRNINSVYGKKFDLFADSLMDYPTIINFKLGYNESNWESYNHLISIHVARCPLNCWHCYLYECLKNECGLACSNYDTCNHEKKSELKIKEDWFSAKEIVESFIQRRQSDLERGIKTNVLRITGGEPFLIPTFILEILQELQERNLQNEIFVWTETCLVPLAVIKNDGNYQISDDLLKSMAKFNNFCVHPCFHGLNSSEFEQITGEKIGDYNHLFTGFKRLLNAGIDVYPTFGSNVSDPDLLEKFFNEISVIDHHLPLRLALVEYSAGYRPIQERLESQPHLKSKVISKEKKDEQIQKWDTILKAKTGYNYGDIPRQFVPVFDSSIENKTESGSIVHLFKRPSSVDYQQRFLQIIALPFNTMGTVEFSTKWLNPEILEKRDFINTNSIDSYFWTVNCLGISPNFSLEWATPLRRLHITNISEPKQEKTVISFIVKDFINIEKIYGVGSLQTKISVVFDNKLYFAPCLEKGFGFFGEPIPIELNVLSKVPDLKKLNSLVHEIPNYQDTNGITIKEYPFFFIEGIKEINSDQFLVPNENGKYTLLLRKEYDLIYSFFYATEYRDIPIYLNNLKIYGPLKVEQRIRLKNLDITQQEVSLDINTNRVELTIKLGVNVIQSWYENQFIRLAILFVIYLICFGLILNFLGPAELNVIIGLLLTIVIFFADKLWEVIIKKT